MTLTLHNTLTRKKEPFQPIDPQNVRMYVCGPTVYDFAHIGNARPVIVFDMLFRLLRHIYGEKHVTYARNITDVDDKINARAARDYPDLPLNEAIGKVTKLTEAQFHADIAALGVLEPTVEPRATEHIEEMKALSEALVARGHAYVAQGHVLFHVPSMKAYGKLSNRSLEEMEAGARVEVAPYKKDPMDFVLWKPSKAGEPAWASPAGIPEPGRPGWHIECSAMSAKHLGNVFDIHGGGIDLVFPHHENEIAQSCCGHGTDVMANVWMHNGFLQVEGEKMSKSLGNFITINELLRKWPGDVIRLQMLMTHYRQPLDWTEIRATLARNELEEWSYVLKGYFDLPNEHAPVEVVGSLLDDLNTPEAIARLRELYTKAKKGGLEERLQFAANCKFMGFSNLGKPGLFEAGASGVNVDPDALMPLIDSVISLKAALANNLLNFAQTMVGTIEQAGVKVKIDEIGGGVTLIGSDTEFDKKVQALVDARSEARKRRDFKESDRIRDELAAMGIALKDAKDKTTGEIVTTWEIAR